MMTEATILALFPRIQEISDSTLRNKTINCLIDGITRGGWALEPESCPISLKRAAAKITLVEHINSVADCCMNAYDVLRVFPERNGVRFDRDYILAGALLHDVGKFLEYKKTPDGVQESQTGKLMRHSLSGAVLAVENDLPADVVQMIATHSFEGDKVPHTAESEFLRAMDLLAFNTAVHGTPILTVH